MSIQQDIDDLDRMVDTDAAKDKIRAQIRLISREAASLEVECSGLARRHSEFVEVATKRIAELELAQTESDSNIVMNKRRAWKEFAAKSKRENQIRNINFRE